MKGKQDYRKSYQGQMMKNRLEMIAQIADQLQHQIQPTDQLPNWFVDKIAKTEKRLIESREFVNCQKALGQKQALQRIAHGNTGFITWFTDSDEVRLGKRIGSLTGIIAGYMLVHRIPALKALPTWRKWGVYTAVYLSGRMMGKFIGKKFEPTEMA